MSRKYCCEIRRYNSSHTCTRATISQDHSKLDSNTIAEAIKPLALVVLVFMSVVVAIAMAMVVKLDHPPDSLAVLYLTDASGHRMYFGTNASRFLADAVRAPCAG
ncbi:hypothetical protein Ahy_A09g042067 [Arachis hypogaea]|uniref:Uncharacterized protein n=1 Tax=Arachis hypogaea TaxID=3818 RepID=A0A445BEN6_ARAHY|nr:hypothetical protein Ahy_A09g042067 [Arachis hypogaea]